jgi:hypothetical protein
MTMVTGEMDFDGLFELGVSPMTYTPIPFHITNFIMWIVFLILIPIVLGNMLVSNYSKVDTLGPRMVSEAYFICHVLTPLEVF